LNRTKYAELQLGGRELPSNDSPLAIEFVRVAINSTIFVRY